MSTGTSALPEVDSKTPLPTRNPYVEVPESAGIPESRATDERRRGVTGWLWVFAKVLFWGGMLALIAYLLLRQEKLDILLNASGENALVVTGKVIYRGLPVNNGTVRVSLETRNHLHGGSVTVPVTNDGTFSTENRFQATVQPRTITAEYVGSGANNKALRGSSTLELDRQSAKYWWFLGICGAIAILLTLLFTGPFGALKARVLFIVTYLFTFASCVLPIVSAIYIGQNPNLRPVMVSSPVGILKARVVETGDPEWFLNVGGSVVEFRPAVQPADSTTPAAAATSGGQTAGQESDSTEAPATDAATVTPKELLIKGGLVIPLYVLILAMIGAGINTTRKVPEIQRDFDIKLRKLTSTEASDRRVEHAQSEVARVRTDLIETYMYFVAAPFLAIAMYYLLLMASQTPSQQVLVLMAFATGFMSDAVVGKIIAFAKQILDSAKTVEGKEKKEIQAPRSSGVEDKGVAKEKAAAGAPATN
jgi:hypothetical protein